MTPSSLIVGALFLGFVFYVAAKGTLPTYISVFIGPVTPGQPITGPTGTTAIGGTDILGLAGTGTVGSSVANSDLTAGSGLGATNDTLGSVLGTQ